MSVINKMLRDLDRHQVGQPVGAAGRSAQPELRQGTASVGFGKTVAAQQSRPRLRLWLGVGLLLVLTVVAGAGAWWLNQGSASQAPSPVATSATTPSGTDPALAAPAIAAPASALPDAASASSRALSPDAAATPTAAVSLRMESSLSAQRALDALLSAPAPVVASAPVPAPSVAAAPQASAVRPNPGPAAAAVVQAPATPASALAKPHTAAAPSTAAATNTAAASDSVPFAQRQQQAGGDAIAQAQTLWSTGSHDAAIDLMQQSIAAAERSAKTAGNPAGSSVLVALVREMTRMQLAEGRHGAVWELLTRLEPLLGNQPDLWAIRANAAQRLGRHQDSVHAYMMALQSRPDEQRWLLGTAVSLAALGQTSSATEMAERARTLAPISKDILNYLRQSGVTLRDQQ